MIGESADWDFQMTSRCTQQRQLSLVHCIRYHLKYQRLHFTSPMTLLFPWKETLSAASDCSLLKEQSCENEIKGKQSQIVSLNSVNRQLALILVVKQIIWRKFCYRPLTVNEGFVKQQKSIF